MQHPATSVYSIRVFTDGGARGNPGPAAVGVYIVDVTTPGQPRDIARIGKRIGETTNNVAEYEAVQEALRYLETVPESRGATIGFFLDSLLVVNQLNGIYRIREPNLREKCLSIRALESGFHGSVTYGHIPREQNRIADSLVNRALDGLI